MNHIDAVMMACGLILNNQLFMLIDLKTKTEKNADSDEDMEDVKALELQIQSSENMMKELISRLPYGETFDVIMGTGSDEIQ
ncbi:MAG: hypothetical protein ACYSW3_01975 [Planctomycetota bacterium]